MIVIHLQLAKPFQYLLKHIVAKDVVGLLLGEIVSIVQKNTSLQRMWLAYQYKLNASPDTVVELVLNLRRNVP